MAFSLIELMLVVGIISILAALAVPSMGPQVDIAKLDGSGEVVASFLARAQAEAIASRRCVRVWVDDSDDDDIFLMADRLNTYDCDVSPATAPRVDASADLWINFARRRLDHDILEVTWDTVPSETTAAVLGGDEPDQFRFRPSGRLYSNDASASGHMVISAIDVTDDDGVLKITHTSMGAGLANTKKVLVEAQGLICVMNRGQDPLGTGNNLSCP